MSQRPVDRASWEEQWELFHAALDRPPDERTDFLDEACRSDEMRRAVDKLLESHEHGTGPLDSSPALEAVDEMYSSGADDATLFEPLPRLRPGQVLAERFRIVRHLGEGGMGSVYEAHDPELETSLAIKILRPEIAASEAALARFRREIQLARQVTHPNVCRVFDLDRDGSLDFLTMELVEGTTLEEKLAGGAPLPTGVAAPLVEQICAALAAAHAVGVVHRDLKPANIMLVERDGTTRVVVMDFGLARSLGRDSDAAGRLTATGQLLGTPAYMAPEQLDGADTGPAADIYALGIILFEMVTGHRPFEGETSYSIVTKKLTNATPSPRTLNPELDRRWERTILRCLERRSEDRFDDVTEVAAALRGDLGVSIPSRRRRRRLSTLAAAGLLVAGVSGYLWWSSGEVVPVESPSAAAAVSAPTTEPWVLVSSFVNETGDPLFDDVVDAALGRELSNSRQIRLVPRERVGDALRLMGRPADSELGAETAREVALRDGEIPFVVTGRIERVGDSYLLSADLIDVAQGGQIGGTSERAATEADILPAVRRLSNTVRDVLGESEREIRASAKRLEQVTTPSLRALRLYTQADELILTDGDVAMELLTEAIEEDPSFAMAHILLAHALRNARRSPDEYQARAQRAFELSEDVPEREKFFIRGSYHSMHGNREEAVTNYATLVRLHPDHRWAGNNVFNTLAYMGRQDEAVPYAVLSADNRPNDFHAQARTAMALTQWAGQIEAAHPYLERARELRPSLPESNGYLEAWVDSYPVFAAWLADDAEAVRRELAVLEAEIATRREGSWLAWFAACGYASIGQIDRAFALDRGRRMLPTLVAWMRGDDDRIAELLAERDDRVQPRGQVLRLLLLTQTDRAESVEADLDWLRRQTERTDFDFLPAHVPGIVEGALSLAAGETEAAVELLGPSLAAERQRNSVTYFVGADLLASAYRTLGRTESALRVLEIASRQRHRSFPSGAMVWLWTESRLAETYRELGRDAEARRVEARLRDVLRLADAEFPIRVPDRN